MVLAALSLLALLPWSTLARFHGNVPRAPGMPKIGAPLDTLPASTNGTALPPYDTWYYFDQLIDHSEFHSGPTCLLAIDLFPDNPSLGTFKQRYYFTYEYYKPGGPISACNAPNTLRAQTDNLLPDSPVQSRRG